MGFNVSQFSFQCCIYIYKYSMCCDDFSLLHMKGDFTSHFGLHMHKGEVCNFCATILTKWNGKNKDHFQAVSEPNHTVFHCLD